MSPDMTNEYKLRHEAFVSGNDGRNYQAILMILTILPFFSILPSKIAQYINLHNETHHFVLEFFFFACPVLLSVTTLSFLFTENFLIIPEIIIAFLIYAYLFPNNNLPRERNVLGLFRGCVMFLTLICILAVDFPVFPRSFSKTETFGIGLMDLGVPFFVISSSIVIPFRRVKSAKFNFNKSAVIFSLGLMRLLSVKTLDYQEHVTEYGVHWNFFFTILLLDAFQVLLNSVKEKVMMTKTYWFELYSGACIIFIYQVFLNHFGLQEYLFSDGRQNLIQQNKEGIFGTIGYVGLMQISQFLGYKYFKHFQKGTKSSLFLSLGYLFLIQILFNFAPPSRRLTNAPFILFSYFTADFLIGIFQYCQISSDYIILSAINRNQLPIFLIGNLLTGFVNMSFATIDATDIESMVILVIYTFVVSYIVTLFPKKLLR
eukprot:maker-scaffold_4-snap-gene-5.63-mRNA-1 protein AED:0.00 eAED:0.00 QI:62/1/1/1/1/1/3/454/429